MPPKSAWPQGLVLLSVLLVVMLTALLAADIWSLQRADGVAAASAEAKASAKYCKLQFPKWFGCAMAAHENLAGGLIAGVMALMSAWWAGAVIREQIRVEVDARNEASNRQTAERINGLAVLVPYYDRLLSPFERLASGERDYRSALKQLKLRGDLIPFIGNRPEPYSFQANMMYQRLDEMRKNVEAYEADVLQRAVYNQAIEATLDGAIEALVAETHALREAANDTLARDRNRTAEAAVGRTD